MKSLLLFCTTVFGAGIIFQVAPAEGGTWPENCGDAKVHNFFFGSPEPRDRLLYTQHIVKESKFLRKHSYDVTIPTVPAQERITFIEVLDQRKDGTGGCVYLNGGGVGQNKVTLHVKSQRNQGVDFVVNVFGH